MRYAREKDWPHVWIDQECIYQDIPSNVERHLQVMHRVYSESRWTAAILSTSLGCSDKEADAFLGALYKHNDPKAKVDLSPYIQIL